MSGGGREGGGDLERERGEREGGEREVGKKFSGTSLVHILILNIGPYNCEVCLSVPYKRIN